MPDALRLNAQSTQANLTQRSGIYVVAQGSSSGQAVLGYGAKNRGNEPPICSVDGVATAAGIGVDQGGNLVVGVNGAGAKILVFRGPKLCGPQVGSFADAYGQPDDIATKDALNGKILIANVFDGSKQSLHPGSISICTLSNGCKTNLTNPAMNEVFGVAMDARGNCWASALNVSETATLTFFKHCGGTGEPATGFVNPYPGGLDFDAAGNLVSLSFHDGAVYVYRGCKPTCTKIGGPLLLRGPTTFAHLDRRSTKLIAADFHNFRVDVYTYTPTQLTFEYDFDNGIDGKFLDGIAVNPPSKR